MVTTTNNFLVGKSIVILKRYKHFYIASEALKPITFLIKKQGKSNDFL